MSERGSLICIVVPVTASGYYPRCACTARVSWVCVSVTQHLTSQLFVRFTNDTTCLTANEGHKFSLKMLRCRATALSL